MPLGCMEFGLRAAPLSPIPFSCSPFAALAGSRGSSWHRWPMLRLTHLAHGRSYMPTRTSVSEKYQRYRLSGTNPIKGRTKSHVICCHWHEAGRISLSQPQICQTLKQADMLCSIGSEQKSKDAAKVAHRAPAVDTCYKPSVSADDSKVNKTTMILHTVIDFAPLLRARMVVGGHS